jgi:hypothetical protein
VKRKFRTPRRRRLHSREALTSQPNKQLTDFDESMGGEAELTKQLSKQFMALGVGAGFAV